MAAAYGVSVRDPELTPRRMWALLNHLPPQFRRPGEHWSVESELLALLVDHVAYLTWVTLRANGAKSAPKPRPIPRPPRRTAALASARPERGKVQFETGRWADFVEGLSRMDGVIVHGA